MFFSAEPVYRQVEQEWKHFIEAFTDVLVEVDSQIPHLPPKDVIHRIYRDVRDLFFCPEASRSLYLSRSDSATIKRLTKRAYLQVYQEVVVKVYLQHVRHFFSTLV